MSPQPDEKPQLGPDNIGLRMTYAEFMAADYELGSYYELADGRLCAWPFPNPGHAMTADWLLSLLLDYSHGHEEVINFCGAKGYVTVPGRKRDTALRPDLAAYRGVPLFARNTTWQDISPLLVAEVTAPEHVDKDVGRNLRLYLQVPSIEEYWLVDGRDSLDYPTLRVHRRNGKKWKIIEVAPRAIYTTPLLPDFTLLNDHRRYCKDRFTPPKQRGTARPKTTKVRVSKSASRSGVGGIEVVPRNNGNAK